MNKSTFYLTKSLKQCILFIAWVFKTQNMWKGDYVR